MTTATGIHLKFERTLDAPIEHVYKLLTEAAYIPRWYGPSDDFKIRVHEWEARVGGAYRIEFITPDGKIHIVVGEFRELVKNGKVAYTWSWEGQEMDTLVTFTLKADGKKTRLTLVHDGFATDEVRSHHEDGWGGSMQRLVRAAAAS